MDAANHQINKNQRDLDEIRKGIDDVRARLDELYYNRAPSDFVDACSSGDMKEALALLDKYPHILKMRACRTEADLPRLADYAQRTVHTAFRQACYNHHLHIAQWLVRRWVHPRHVQYWLLGRTYDLMPSEWYFRDYEAQIMVWWLCGFLTPEQFWSEAAPREIGEWVQIRTKQVAEQREKFMTTVAPELAAVCARVTWSR